MDAKPFWEAKTLDQLDESEWESLCDGCGKCCLHKLEDEEDGELYFTRISCRYLDGESCRCTAYEARQERVPDCLVLRPGDVQSFQWLPATCAYRLLAEGKPLPPWHHLLSGSTELMHRTGMSVRGRVISEEHVHPDGFEEHVVRWVR